MSDDRKPDAPSDHAGLSAPRILKVAVTRADALPSRRAFIQNLIGGATAVVGAGAAGCSSSYDIVVGDDGGKCNCHAVCTCDTDANGEGHQYSSTYDGSRCTCDTVCTCDSVCTCQSEGGSGSTYYYPN